ncbi:hypothetical protein [Actinomadura sp. BRA 177]|uniref:hypothetical protein n=1 Tax=Actinomadura sp. BRA 177 TaxID=2745202 RepID=UPI0015957E6B|nr:hypothetical protein [Actinomadura sp. BRA 177]NVI89941.1 hypothetical protein [Actinomadura sp. BRA 177]
MEDAGLRAQLRQFRNRMACKGIAAHQIAAALIQQYDVNPRVAFRHALGLTQTQVAEQYNRRWPDPTPKTRKEISYWECWGGPGESASSPSSARAPSYQDLGRLAQLYGCRVDDLLFGPSRDPGPAPTAVPYHVIADILSSLDSAGYAEDVEVGGVPVTLCAAIGEGSITVSLSRRQFTELLAAGGLAALIPATALAPAPASAGTGAAETAGYWRQILTAHQAGHHLLTPGAHITALTDALSDISAVRDHAGSEARHQLRRMQAEFAEHISWLYRETGDLASCWRWADRAAEWSLETGDTSMATYMMLRRATVALDQGHHARAADLARAARHADWDVPPALQATAHLYLARAQAVAGVVAESDLDRADELLAAGHRTTDPAYLRFYTSAFGEFQRATCYMSAGVPGRAATILQARLTALPSTSHRDRAVHLTRLGAAHAADQVPDAAAIAGIGALTEVRHSESQHALNELQRLDAALTRGWPRQPKVREFHESLVAATAATNRHAV